MADLVTTQAHVERFWSRVALPDENGCMLWLGARLKSGYGSAWLGSKTIATHRLSLWLSVGAPLAPGDMAAHSCRNRNCVAPTHLRWATRQENVDDQVRDETNPQGERNTNAKLTASQVTEIRRLYSSGRVTQAELALRYGVSDSNISAIVRRVSWGFLEAEAAS